MVCNQITTIEKACISNGFWKQSNAEARHGKALKGLLERYFK